MTENTQEPQSKRGVPVWAQILVWVLLLGLLGVVAVGMVRSKEGPIVAGDKVKDFEVTLFDGFTHEGQSTVSLSDLQGKVVVINFWASWCKPCEQEAPDLVKAYETLKSNEDVVFIGLDYVDTEPEARAYLKKFGVSYPNGPDMGTRVSQMFRIQGVPETYFIDRDGILRYTQIGPFSSSGQIVQQVNALLQNP